jgi:hypothetical protein
MNVVPVIQSVSIIEKQGVTVLSQPKTVTVTSVERNVSVLSLNKGVTVVSQPKTPNVISQPKMVTVIAAAQNTGPKVFFSSTPPFGAKLNDIWIKTA